MANQSRFQKVGSITWKFIREMIPVMLGVYFAFVLSDYSEARKTANQFKEYKQLIKKEVSQNLDNINPTYEYHKSFKEDLIQIANHKDPYNHYLDYQMKGLRPGFVSSSAYQTGIQTGIIQEFDLDMIQQINNIYTYQSKYDDYNKSLLSGFINKELPQNSTEVKSIASNLIMSMNDIIISERNLIEYYEALIDKLEQQ